MAATSSTPRLSLMAPVEDVHQDTVAPFIMKLWGIVEKPDYSRLICWSESGKTFHVGDTNTFSKKVLPHYFKHSNFNSFVRQLNLYGFRKVSRPESQTDDAMEFWHTNFRRGHPELLHLVQRRISHKNPVGVGLEVDKGHHHLSSVMSDIHQMKGRQEGFATILDALKQDNTHLRHEIGVLKEKHVRQQNILNKIIHFLVHMVYKGKIPSTRRPSRTGNRLMLMDSEGQPPQPKKMRVDTDPVEEFSIEDLRSFSPLSPTTEFLNNPVLQAGSPILTTLLSSVPVDTISSPLSNSAPSVSSPAPSTFSPAPSPFSPAPSPFSPVPSTFSAASDTVVPIPEDHLIPPAPSSLLPVPHPENRRCMHGQLEHQQLGLNNFTDLLSGQFSLDPALVADFVLSENLPQLPDYDFVDTARLLESLTSSEDDPISHDSSLVPVQGGVAVADPSLYSFYSEQLEQALESSPPAYGN